MNVTQDTLPGWKSLEAVVKTFECSEFICFTKQGHANVQLGNDTGALLRIIMTDDGFSSKLFSQLRGKIQYLLLLNGKEGMFVKKEYTESLTPRYNKFKFSLKSPKNTTIALIKLLTVDRIITFDNLFNTEKIIDEFYVQYTDKLNILVKSIDGISDEKDRLHYAQIIMHRMLFLHFVQAGGFLSKNNHFLRDMLNSMNGGNYYRDFLRVLFFNVLNKPVNKRKHIRGFEHDTIPFLNGGLFRPHRIEKSNEIHIENPVFYDILEFLSKWLWYVDETADEGGEIAINPEILGHIFEKTITNQKGKGAYYTPSDVTKFITESTVLRHCVGAVNDRFGELYDDVKSITDKKHLEYLYFDVISKMTILDNSCGSGAFLLSASKLLFDLYVATWKAISSSNTPAVEKEKAVLSESKSNAYYFKRRIITTNLYGVDLEEDATEICKLRLWLSLVSEIPTGASAVDVEPLPNIDYNIMIGNSLLGYINMPDSVQNTLDGSKPLPEIITEIDRLKADFNDEYDPEKSDSMKDDIDGELAKLNRMLDKAKNASISDKFNMNEFSKLKPFHYRLHFNHVLRNGGFDIILGNPPYVEKGKIGYPTGFLSTHDVGNSFAYFFEISLQLLKKGGWIGYIVPVASISTDRMIPLQNMLMNRCSNLMISNYDDRPGKLFIGLEDCRSSIIFGQLQNNYEGKCVVKTTGYNRWHTEDRQNLLSNINYTNVNTDLMNGCIPKIKSDMEMCILEKIQDNCLLALQCHINQPKKSKNNQSQSTHVVWYHNAPRYWIRGMSSNPKPPSQSNDGYRPSVSSHTKSIHFKTEKAAIVAQAILNSSLFYWFFIKTSNCRDLSGREIETFKVNLDSFSTKDIMMLKQILKKLMADYERNSKVKKNDRKGGNNIKYVEFYPKHSKTIMNKIDKLLAKHYKLTPKELKYIITFDEKFRMGSKKQGSKKQGSKKQGAKT